MSYYSSTSYHHLTPRGWETGEPPPDRVETWKLSIEQASGWSKEYRCWTCTWANEGMTRAERDALRDKHNDHIEPAGRSGNMISTVGAPL